MVRDRVSLRPSLRPGSRRSSRRVDRLRARLRARLRDRLVSWGPTAGLVLLRGVNKACTVYRVYSGRNRPSQDTG